MSPRPHTLSAVPPVPDHGGAIARAEARFGRPAEGWIDLSTGINPWPWPVPPIPPDAWHRLPESADLDRLLAAAAACYGAADPSGLVAAPGSQALIQTLPGLLPPRKVAVLGFTYAEHVRCWRLCGHAVRVVDDLEAAGEAEVVVVVNPNNPDGRQIQPPRLLALADRLAGRGGLLVVDEAFADVTPAIAMVAHAGHPALAVLRSFGKFFGLAGLRLGFAVLPADLGRRLADRLGPWAVSGPALAMGTLALTDADWIAATRRRLDAAATALDAILAGQGLAVVGGTALYRLVEHPQAEALFAACARQGILVRAFDARPGWLRFGLPPDERAADRLRAALSA